MVKTATAQKIGSYRWVICSLLLFATTVNYMDRNVIGFLKDYFCSPEGFGWTNTQFGMLTSMFTLFYAGFTLAAGAIIDRIGTKLGLALSLIVWSVAGMASAFMGKGLGAHIAARSVFGAGESGNFPASIKTVAEWFPKKERALATGIFNSGSNIGAMICALFVPWCLLRWTTGGEFAGVFHGWQMAFLITGLVGFVWLIFWQISYNTPANLLKKGKITQAEYDYIHSDKDEPAVKVEGATAGTKEKVSWFKLLTYRQTWSFAVGKFMTDGIWWFLLFWLPTYVRTQFGGGMSAEQTAYMVMITNFVVFGIAIIGSVYGGSIPMMFMNRGWATYKARMTALLIIAFFPLLLVLTQYFGNISIFGSNAIYLAISVICIGGAAHQAWSANLFTTVSDMFPKKAVGSVTGIGAAFGGLGGVLVQMLSGFLNDKFIDTPATAYMYMFCVCALAYLVAWVVMKMLVPTHKPITDL